MSHVQTTTTTRDDMDTDWEMPQRKRARCNKPEHNHHLEDETAERTKQARLTLHEDGHEHMQTTPSPPQTAARSNSNTAANLKLMPKAVAPFMAQHIPAHYAPLGKQPHTTSIPSNSDMNSKFCYRHRPDMLCRRQADEPSMDLLQRNLETLSESDKQGIVQVWNLFSAAPSKHRDLMLQGILTQCCFPQLSFLSANVQKLIKIDFLSTLPPEVSFRILSSLDTISLCKAAQVSRKWRTLADDDVVWHRMCEQHIDRKCTKCGWGLPLMDRKRLRASKRQIQLRAAGRGLNDWSPSIRPIAEADESVASLHLDDPSSSSDKVTSSTSKQKEKAVQMHRKTRQWKHVYRDRFCIGKNWKHGKCVTRVLKSHTNGVQCLQLRDNILATGSYDCTIKIWDLDKGVVIRTLAGHTMEVRCLQLDNNKLISGSMDKSIKVWNWRTGECLNTYSQHTEGVIGLHFVPGLPNLLVSASADHTVRVWDFEARTTHALHGHSDWVNSVKIDEASRTVFSASDDFTVKLWDLDTKRCIRTFEGHVAHVQQVILLDRNFDAEDHVGQTSFEGTPSEPGSPRSVRTTTSSNRAGQAQDISPVMTYANLRCPRKVDPYDEVFQKFDGRQHPPKYMLTSALDNTIRMWEVSTGRCIRTFFGHVEGVWALAADSLRIVSGAEDRMLKIWDPRTGLCERTFTGHAGPITCVGLGDSKMCSGGEDGEIRVYCFGDCPGHNKQMSPEVQMGNASVQAMVS
ncbi:hypothetical protein LTR66_014806 [Elasticomyces elasticus]|nr:hypothetical protein LTR66_014806 [Elasticomyces elasticus]